MVLYTFMEKVCDCGVPYATHARCVECWLLLHTDEKYCYIFNSDDLIGFTTNGVRCWTCVPGSNKNKENEAKQKRGRKPMEESQRNLRQLKINAVKQRILTAREKRAEVRKAKGRIKSKEYYQANRERILKAAREKYLKREKYPELDTKCLDKENK